MKKETVDWAAKKLEAKKAAELAKEKAKEKLLLAKNKPPAYINMPEPVKDAEQSALNDLNELQSGFRKRALDEAKRFRLATDSEYWCCVCFQTREQKEAFLKALDLLKYHDKYIDGQLLAKQLNIALPAAEVPYNVSDKVDPAWEDFTK